MKRLASLILVKICLASLILAAPAGAAISPVKIENADVFEHSVQLRVWDPQFLFGWTFFYDCGSQQVTNFNISNGIARWVEKGALSWFRYAIYDPERGLQLGRSCVFTDIVEESLQESNGVVSGWGQDWANNSLDKFYLVSYSTYDPIRGGWVEGNSGNFQSIAPDPMLVNKDGIVAFYYEVVNPPNNAVLGYIYDYSRHSWREGIFKLSPSFSIDQLSIKFIVGGDTIYRGYNPIEVGVWQPGHTRNKSFFSVYPNSGKRPLWVSFWDLSIGALPGSDWTFGDGGSASQGSVNYRYTKPGIYVAYQNVIGIYGSDWTKTNIYITGGGMPPSLPLLLLD